MKINPLATPAVLAAIVLATPGWAQTSTPSRHDDDGSRVAAPARASDRGTVVSVTPIVREVRVPRRNCHDEPVAVRRPSSGAGALIGAIAGGAIGNAVGAGAGRGAATALGVVGGALVGDSIEGEGQSAQMQSMRRCTTETVIEERTVAYNVVYDYAGRQYTTRMRQDPGDYVLVQMHARPLDAEAAPRRYERDERAGEPIGVPVPSTRPAPVYVERPLAWQGYSDDRVYQTMPPRWHYEPGYSQFGTGLVIGALIGYGTHWGGHRHGGRHHWRGHRR